MFGATCSPYLLQETLQTHLPENVAGRKFSDKFYVDNYMNTYDRECDLIRSKPKVDELMNEAHMPLQEWVSNSELFNSMNNATPPATQKCSRSKLGSAPRSITSSSKRKVNE